MSNFVYQLKVTVYTPRGEFSGYAGDSSADINDVISNQIYINNNINQITTLVLTECPDDIKVSTTLNKHMLEQSIIQSKIVSIMAKE